MKCLAAGVASLKYNFVASLRSSLDYGGITYTVGQQ